MSKDYYIIKKRDGTECQAIDVMKEAIGTMEFVNHCVATAFKYVSRIGRKPDNDCEKEIEKIKEYMKWANETSKEFTKMAINNFCRICELGEELKKYM